MGMAASQARYLALVARKSNCEWEGQQINQARTALANQSANLFNQLLSLDVPEVPQTSDYTEIQYSYSDGTNDSVISSWQQLSSADPNYNYLVTHYYYADIYTGSQKNLSNPQVNVKSEVVENTYVDPSATLNDDGSYTVVLPNGSEVTCQEITSEATAADSDLEDAFNDFATAKQLAYDAGAIPSEAVYGYQDATGTWHFFLKEELDEIDNMSPTVSWDATNDTYSITTADGEETYTYEAISDVENDTKLETALREFEESTGLIAEGGTLTTDNVYGYQDSDGTWHFFIPDDELTAKDYTSNTAIYVGNCLATELTTLTEAQAAELAQILKDCPDSAISQYLSFDYEGNLLYDGQGIYVFTMNGTTYFTTESDLYNSLTSAVDSSKPTENQNKLAYYNASYVQTKIEETNYALLETDESGRFTSVKFDDDSVVYTLNVETVTDEDAYQDAMNEYLYQKEVYEKTIADINAQTSIIQQEDRTLELRLTQLDTEQQALATEMDAVKSVIDDNVEKTFSTFSD